VCLGRVAPGQSAPQSAGKSAHVRSLLLSWARNNGREFPWRGWRDPYRLLVTEVLLKQTRAESVSEVVGPFFRMFPTSESLAVADSDLETLIKPLGFGSQRALQLRSLAAELVRTPSVRADANSLVRLPGIGPYASGMVAATLGARESVAVDTNIARVVCRVFGLIPSHAEPRKSTNVREQTRSLIGASASPVQVLWAILDLAASTCRARSAQCARCPLQRACMSSTTHRQADWRNLH
jgi:A/G-specific adenine glycosylase